MGSGASFPRGILHSPQPEVFLAAASQRTKNIRLGHGIIQLTTNHPARVAEKVACLDLVSNGRVEFGMGEGASITELGPFDRSMEEKQAIWEDGVRCVLPMFKDGGWEYDGPYFKFPLRNVLPKPIQKPHPPLWVACSQLETIELAGRCGIGALGFQFLSAEMAHAWVHAYYNSFTRRQQKLTDYQSNCNIAMVSYFMCAETDEEARRRADGVTFFQFSLAWYSGSRNRERRRRGPSISGTSTKNGSGKILSWRIRPLTGGLIGSPETIRRKLRRFESSHVDQIILLNQAGKNTHQHICESLELFAKEVMPEFVGREPEHQAWKQSVLDGTTVLDELDTTAYKERAGVGKGVCDFEAGAGGGRSRRVIRTM